MLTSMMADFIYCWWLWTNNHVTQNLYTYSQLWLRFNICRVCKLFCNIQISLIEFPNWQGTMEPVGVRTRVITSASPRADYIDYTNVSRDLTVPVSWFYPLISFFHSRSPPGFTQSLVTYWFGGVCPLFLYKFYLHTQNRQSFTVP